MPNVLPHHPLGFSVACTAPKEKPSSAGLAECNKIEVYVDLACSKCAKMITMLSNDVLPQLEKRGLSQPVEFRYQLCIQPWFHNSTQIAEVAIAVGMLNQKDAGAAGAAFERFAREVIASMTGELHESKTSGLTRPQIYERIADAAVRSGAVADKRAILDMVMDHAEGNKVRQDLIHAVQLHRQRGVHVSPTVHVNGIEATSISSASTAADWFNMLTSL